MYYRYFGLDQPPFRITPDTRLFFPGGNRGAVLEALVYAIANGEGIVKVVGEVGSGKTMLCRMLEQELPDTVDVVYLANPSLTPEDIVHAIAFELKLPVEPSHSRLEVMRKLQEFLLEKHAANRRVVAFIEEAQGMPLETLEEIRLLSNLETKIDKLLQIVLFGQPELDEILSAHAIRQLRDRITYSFSLQPLSTPEIRDYLLTRLRASGARATEVFTPGAIRAVATYSHGLLRRINILADKALLAAYADNQTLVTAKHVRRAAADSEFKAARPAWLPWAAGGGALAAALAAAAVMFWPAAPVPAPADTAAVTQAAPASPAPVPAAAAAADPVTATATAPAAPTAAPVATPPAAPVLPEGMLTLDVLEPDAPRIDARALGALLNAAPPEGVGRQ